MFVLFLESRLRLSSDLSRVLSAQALSCFNIQDYSEFDTCLKTDSFPHPDVIVLDQDFETRTATHFLPNIKSKCPNAKIIVLAEVEGPKERVRFLEIGADDCITKPIDIEELLLRIRKLYSRSQEAVKPNDVNLKTKVNFELKDIEISGERMHLSKKEYMLAETFLNHPGQVFSRLILLDLCWGFSSEIESNVVEVTVAQLRKKLRAHNSDAIIHSRRNVGYWLEPLIDLN